MDCSITKHSEQKYKPTIPTRRRAIRRGERGASLIEVMTVLIILLIGIFIFIRVFPVGFASLAATENRTLASRLAQQQLEQLKADQENLPRAILYATYDANGRRSYVAGEDPDDLDGNILVSGGAQNPYFTDVNKYRAIEGEPVKVPLPTAVGSGSAGGGVFGVGSLYTVRFGPMYMDQRVGNPEAVPNPTDQNEQDFFAEYLRVYGPPLLGRVVDSNEGDSATLGRYAGLIRTPQTYLIDYNDGDEAFILFAQSSKPRTFFISYSYEESDSIKDEDDVAILVPANSFAWIKIPRKNGSIPTDILERSESVTRSFQRIAKSAAFSTGDGADPYEYKLLSDNVQAAGAGTSFANIGVMAFNPAGASFSERTPFGQRAFTAYIDYAVLDWHIIREDREVGLGFETPLVGGGTAHLIRTTLPFIKKIGDTEPDDSIYEGLYRDANSQVDLQLFDLQGATQHSQADPTNNLGRPMTLGIYDNGAVTPADADAWVDLDNKSGSYTTGRIYLNAQRVPRGSQVRVLYKANGDWAVAVQKANSEYRQELSPDGSARGRPSVDTSQVGNMPPGPITGSSDTFGRQGTALYFQSTDLNKSITARFQYIRNDLTTGSTDRVVQTAPVQLTLNNLVTENVGSVPVKFATVNVASFLPGLKNATSWQVQGGIVQGVSVRARVIWKDGDQSPVTDDRGTPTTADDRVIQKWRIQDVDSYVTPTTGAGT